jgi:cobalamin biosynthesis protein CbiD
MQVNYLTQEQCSGEPESLYASMEVRCVGVGDKIGYVLSKREVLGFRAVVFVGKMRKMLRC